MEKLKTLESKHVEQLDLLTLLGNQREEERKAINSRFEEYRQWVKDSMNTEDNPYIQIVAAIVSA